MTQILNRKAPAKLNLGLRVGPTTNDGYHEIRTVYQTISLMDRLSFRESSSESDELVVTGPISVPSNSDNLILRAIQRVRGRGYTVPSISVELNKRIPNQAGLGGGSSDAAETLLALADLVPGNIPDDELHAMARAMGADVPFFLEKGTQLATGRGDELRRLPGLDGQGLLCLPPYGISTEWAYRSVEPRSRDDLPGLIGPRDPDRLSSWRDLDLTNDFEPLIAENYELHPKLLGTLTDASSSSGLTGSGSALYALFERSKDLQDVKKKLSARFDECQWFQFEFIPHEND